MSGQFQGVGRPVTREERLCIALVRPATSDGLGWAWICCWRAANSSGQSRHNSAGVSWGSAASGTVARPGAQIGPWGFSAVVLLWGDVRASSRKVIVRTAARQAKKRQMHFSLSANLGGGRHIPMGQRNDTFLSTTSACCGQRSSRTHGAVLVVWQNPVSVSSRFAVNLGALQ
jgi:hypothetical protein